MAVECKKAPASFKKTKTNNGYRKARDHANTVNMGVTLESFIQMCK